MASYGYARVSTLDQEFTVQRPAALRQLQLAHNAGGPGAVLKRARPAGDLPHQDKTAACRKLLRRLPRRRESL
jgi:hypothetical protein